MFNRSKLEKVIYFWFLPFSVGIYLSAGYIVTHNIFLKSNKVRNYLTKHKMYNKEEYKKSSESIYLEEENITLEDTKDNISISNKIKEEENNNSVLSKYSQEQTEYIQNLSRKSLSNKEKKQGSKTEDSAMLKKASSDKLEKILNELFQTLPKP